MKSYTDIEQSKKLAGVLPIESADMCYRIVAYNPNDTHVYQPYCFVGTLSSDIPCWSLATLIETLPSEVEIHQQTDGHKKYYRVELYMDNDTYLSTAWLENAVDACVKIILKLKEKDLL